MDVDSAKAMSARTVQVLLYTEPLAVSPIGPQDVMNIARWQVYLTGTTDYLPIIRVEYLGSDDGSEIYFLALVTLYSSFESTAAYTVKVTGVIDVYGDPVGTDSAQFYGCPVDASRDNARNGIGMVDLRNSPTPASPAGSLVTGSNGDYVLEQSGEPLFRKLIIRRLMTATGAFFHLPNYGKGLREKNFYRDRDLVGLQKAVLDELRQEPEAADAKVVVTLGADGQLVIQLAVQQKGTNNPTSITYPVARF